MSQLNPIYFHGQGALSVETEDVPGFRFLGSVSAFALEPKATFMEHRESVSGNQMLDGRFPDTQDLDYSFTMDDCRVENFVQMFYGHRVEDLAASATFSGTALPAALSSGLRYRFGKAGWKITAVTDSSVAPKTVPASAYTSGRGGTIEFDDVACTATTATIGGVAYTLPLLVAGTTVATDTVSILSKRSNVVSMMFEGINTTDGKEVVVLIPRGANDPVQTFEVIGGNKLTQAQIKGKALANPNQLADPIMGGYGSIEIVK